MHIDYHDLTEQQFEDLVAAVCYFLLGSGIQKFSSGPDGGRDARFTGTAELFPSKQEPHKGKFIIQAKHSENPFAKVSDTNFLSSPTSVINEEIPRLKKLCKTKEIDHYLIFTNRRAGGGATVAAENALGLPGIKSVHLVGIETLDLHLKRFPEAIPMAELKSFLSPLRVFADELAEVVLNLKSVLDKKPKNRPKVKLNRVSFAKKNKKNELPELTAKMIISSHLKDFGAIQKFLEAPANATVREQYELAAEEFNSEILEKRADGARMDQLLNDLVARLRTRDGDIARNLRLTRTVVYFMYWSCDIGEQV